MNHRLTSLCLVLFLIISSAGYVTAEDKKPVTLEWSLSGAPWSILATPSYQWLDSGKILWWNRRVAADKRSFEVIHPGTGKAKKMFDSQKALVSLASHLGKENTPGNLSYPGDVDGTGGKFLYVFRGDLFVLHTKSAEFERITDTPEKEINYQFGPNGKSVSFVRENDLYIFDLKTGTEKRITDDGTDTLMNGKLSWVYWEEIFGRRDNAYWWSADARKLAWYKTDDSPVSISYFINHRSKNPRLITQRYPKPGEPNPKVTLCVRDLDSSRTVMFDSKKFPYEYILRVKWLPDNRRIAVITLNRDQTDATLYFMDAGTGAVEKILEEHDDGWITISEDLVFLKKSDQFLWVSERDGYAHIYRYNMDGTMLNQVTKGPWALRGYTNTSFWVRQAIAAVDESKGWIYFAANKKSSLERQIYRVQPDGSGLQQVTAAEGNHRVDFSPDGRYFTDRHSNFNVMPSVGLYRNNGNPLRVLARARKELLDDFIIQYPEYVEVPARDGFKMPAALLKPADFDRNRKYPVLINVYGGPGAPTVKKSWGYGIFNDQVLLNEGYLVFRIDNRSATAISKTLTNGALNKMYTDYELNDLLDGVAWLKKLPFVDGHRIGIWGWSGGGSFTLLAMSRSRAFKAGIAGAGVTDWRYYDSKWSEYTFRTPEKNLKNYDDASLLKYAKDLHGRLLLVHGMADDNVHPQNSWNYVDELVKAGKLFEMMFYPMSRHGLERTARRHFAKTTLDFWRRNL